MVTMCAAVPAHSETLLEIYKQAELNDHQFRAAAARADAGREAANLSRSALLPQIVGQAYYEDSNGTRLIDTNPPEFDIDAETTAYSLGLEQSLIDLSAWKTHKRGKAAAMAADYTFASDVQDLVVRTAEAYFDALNAVDNLNTAKAEEDALAHQLEQTKQRFEVGLTAITEVHEAQAAFDSSTANRLVADGQLGIAFEALEVLTGQSYDALSPLRDSFPVVPPTPVDRVAWENYALENNPDLKTAYQLMEVAKAESESKKYEHLPKLTASAGYYHQDIDGYQAGELEGNSIQVNLNVPIYVGGAISASRRQAYAYYVEANETYLQAKRDIIQAVRSSHLAVLTSAATVKARMQAITSNRSALEATQAGYDVGTRDLVDVLNAQRNLYSAQRDYYSALYTYVLSTLRLRQSAGILTGEQILELDQWLDKANPVIYTR